MGTQSIKKYLVFVSALVILTPGFYTNTWKVVNDAWLENFADGTEAFVVCRLAKSRQDGIFSAGGIIGKEVKIPEGKDPFQYQFEIYYNNIPIQEYKPYKSTPAFQGILFSMLERSLGLDARTNIKVFRFIASIVSACILGLFVLWVLDVFGLFPSLMTLFLIMLSPWITVSGGHLHWMFGILVLPFVVPLIVLQREHKGKTVSSRVWFLSIATAMLIKCLFTGFELISTTLIMMTMPVFLYAIWHRWKLRLFIRRFFSASCAGILGLTAAAVILSVQIAEVDGSMRDGWHHMQQRFLVRTYPDKAKIQHEVSQMALDTSGTTLATLLKKYQGMKAICITTRYGYVGLSFGNLLLIFAAVSALIFIKKRNRALIAVAITTWISFLAPLSWFIIFKSHSVMHPHLDPLAWYMPMFLLLFAGLASVKER